MPIFYGHSVESQNAVVKIYLHTFSAYPWPSPYNNTYHRYKPYSTCVALDTETLQYSWVKNYANSEK